MTTKSKINGIARRMKNAGLKVSRSDRSETLYARFGQRDLRLSGHELGVADYGSREQRHIGPEVIISGDEAVADILQDCLYEIRDYLRDYGWKLSEYGRKQAADSIRKLRGLIRKAAK